ncbi:hypothetical protein ANCDUO_16979, partial [Ancylostoma duodenale]
PKPRFLWIPVVLRMLFIPFFMFCNYQPAGKVRTVADDKLDLNFAPENVESLRLSLITAKILVMMGSNMFISDPDNDQG